MGSAAHSMETEATWTQADRSLVPARFLPSLRSEVHACNVVTLLPPVLP